MLKENRFGISVFSLLFVFFIILNYCQPLEGDDLNRFSMNILDNNNFID